jgi:hypothetical protein
MCTDGDMKLIKCLHVLGVHKNPKIEVTPNTDVDKRAFLIGQSMLRHFRVYFFYLAVQLLDVFACYLREQIIPRTF